MAATGIPSVSPEIGTSDPCSETFFMTKDLACVTSTIEAQWPLTKTMFKKIGSQLEI